MARKFDQLNCFDAQSCPPGDIDLDDIADLDDVAERHNCFTGATGDTLPAGCESLDIDFDTDLGLDDYALIDGAPGGPATEVPSVAFAPQSVPRPRCESSCEEPLRQPAWFASRAVTLSPKSPEIFRFEVQSCTGRKR
ncbi:MAG: hypothetical protein ACYTHJ_16480 [Planctomycetota bacterium]